MKRQLGSSGIEVSALGMGCWAIGGPLTREGVQIGWGQVDDEESKAAVRAAFDQGITFFDTSDAYGAGHSERILGEVFASNREDVVLGTKFGSVVDEANKQLLGQRADETYIREACEASLRRLRTDYIDLYQFHLGDYPADQALEVRDVLEALVAEGTIRAYSWSTDDPISAKVFAEGPNCAAVQHRQNIFVPAPELLAICEAHGLASINRSPLAMGLLGGKYTADTSFAKDDIRTNSQTGPMRYFKDGKPDPEMLGHLDAMRQILASDGRTVAQGSIAWLWGRSELTIPIPGIRTVTQALENGGALQFGPLRSDQMDEIEALAQSWTGRT